MEEPEIRRACRLPREPQATRVGAQILMHLEGCPRRPVGIAPIRPGFIRPAGIGEGCGFGNTFVGEHLAEDLEDLVFGLAEGLALDAIGLFVDDGREEDVGSGQEVLCREGLEYRVISPGGRRGIQEKLGIVGPEGLLELHEDLDVRAHVELLDRGLFPARQLGVEGDGFVLEDAQGKGADRIGRSDTSTVFIVHGYTVGGVFDPGDRRAESKARIVDGVEESGGFALDDGAVAPGIEDQMVGFAELVEGEVLPGDSKDERAGLGRKGVFPVYAVR